MGSPHKHIETGDALVEKQTLKKMQSGYKGVHRVSFVHIKFEQLLVQLQRLSGID